MPLPHDPKWDARLLEKEPLDEQLGRHRLTVTEMDGRRISRVRVGPAAPAPGDGPGANATEEAGRATPSP